MLDDKCLLLFELISEANQKRIHLGGSPDESLNYFLGDIIYFGVGLRKNMLHECSMPAVVGISGRIGEGTLFFWEGGRGAPAKSSWDQPTKPFESTTYCLDAPPLSRIKRLDF